MKTWEKINIHMIKLLMYRDVKLNFMCNKKGLKNTKNYFKNFTTIFSVSIFLLKLSLLWLDLGVDDDKSNFVEVDGASDFTFPDDKALSSGFNDNLLPILLPS